MINKVIMQDKKECFLCGANGASDPLDRHHIFGGANRNKSEKYGLVVYLCHSRCHEFGENAAHRNRETMEYIRRRGQEEAMKQLGWKRSEFIREFGRNYI